MEHRARKVLAKFNKLDGQRMYVVEDVSSGAVFIHALGMGMAEKLDDIEMEKMKFQVGDKVQKISGYKFPGIVVSVFITTNKELRYVVEADSEDFKYMLHIFNPNQLELRDQ